MLRKTFIVLLVLAFNYIVIGCAFVDINLIQEIQPIKEKRIGGSGWNKILLIDLSGVILEGGLPKLFSQKQEIDPVAKIKEELKKAEKDKRIKAIILRINSPGGSVTASDLIYHEVKRFKEERGIPVIAIIVNVGASGAYYVSTAADKIIVHPTSVIGSIGVIMLKLNVAGLMEKIGVDQDIIKSGRLKDMGSIFRDLTPEEREIFQAMIDNLYKRFISVVADERKSFITIEEVERLADGRIYTAQEGVAIGLVDDIGYIDDAINIAKELAGIKDARLITYYRPGTYKENIYSAIRLSIPQAYPLLNTILPFYISTMGPQFMYLWMP